MTTYLVPVIAQTAANEYTDQVITAGDLIGSLPGGSVSSVNGHSGAVTLSPDDLDDSATAHKFTNTSDVAKLAGIATGAQVNDTAAQILTKLLTVDGAGSGLDADTLDGISSAGFDAAGAAAAAQSAAIAASQPVDSDLTAIAALTTTAFGRSFLTLANAAAGITLLGLGTAATTNSTAYDAAGAAAAAQAASQPLDSDLTAIAALTTTAFGRSLLTGANAVAVNTLLGLGALATKTTIAVPGDITATGTPGSSTFLRGDGSWAAPAAGGGGDMLAANNLSDLVNKATARTNLGVAIGTNVQAWDADLDLLAAVTVGASTILGRGAAGAVAALTPAQAGTVLGLGTIATQAASAVAITGGSVTGITDLAVADGGTGASTAVAARTNLGCPTGYMGQAGATTTTGIGSTITDVTGASVTFTAVAGRRYKITVQADITQGASAAVAGIYIRNGSTTLKFQEKNVANGAQDAFSFFWTDVPGAGSITYKMSAKTTAATMTVDAGGAAGRASDILVEEISA